MSGKILRLGGDEHGFVQLLLPWFDGGRLDADESARVTAHLIGCPRCQADLAWHRKLREALPPAQATGDVDLGWAALRGRLDPAPARKPGRSPRRTAAPWWRWVLALQSTVIVGLAALVVMMVPHDDRYRALGSPGRASDASIVVVFRPEASELQIRQALRDSDARLVDGPTVTGAYLLAAEPARHASAIERLRQQTAVLRVESLAAGATR
ncbi:MAG: zf-HC2 domain-containing protein [Burkholderiales bacterium]